MKDSLGSTFKYNKILHTSVFLSTTFQGLYVYLEVYIIMGVPGGSDGKESACTAGDPGSILGLRRSSGEGNGNPLQDSCLEKSMDSIVHGVAKSQTQLSDFHFTSPVDPKLSLFPQFFPLPRQP